MICEQWGQGCLIIKSEKRSFSKKFELWPVRSAEEAAGGTDYPTYNNLRKN